MKRFAEDYGRIRGRRPDAVREDPPAPSEELVQCIWYDQLFRADGLETDDGRALRVVSPGWWNRGEGPDFKGAQIEFNGRLRNGDVEIHLAHAGWRGHGHHLDSRYDDVMLHVVSDASSPSSAPTTASGRAIPTLLLPKFLESDLAQLADSIDIEHYPFSVEGTLGRCAGFVDAYGPEQLIDLLRLAGEWRMLFKARALRERMDRAGADQAVYEAFLYACGFSHFKHHFAALARQLPYERAQQLAQEDALLLETAFLQLSGLLPAELPEGTSAVPHFGRVRALRRDRLDGLRTLPLEWKRVGVRPNNFPERRLSGAARFVSRTAKAGLVEAVDDIWSRDLAPRDLRRQFEDLFPSSVGFWATHCTWTGKKLTRPSAPIGGGRIRSIIGNVFIPLGLALAREKRDRPKEERILNFFAALPKEPENRIQKAMLPRLFGELSQSMDFRLQQGLLQMHNDWCEPNPSCRNCRVMGLLDREKAVLR